MPRPCRTPPQHPRRIDQSAMRTALLQALARRVERDPTGTITLPTGTTNTEELADVMIALDRARQGARR